MDKIDIPFLLVAFGSVCAFLILGLFAIFNWWMKNEYVRVHRAQEMEARIMNRLDEEARTHKGEIKELDARMDAMQATIAKISAILEGMSVLNSELKEIRREISQGNAEFAGFRGEINGVKGRFEALDHTLRSKALNS
uniref:Uncharacterized protein n=1 Tax=Candidatus Kentrum sp. UNK TaxID=2126344 RepID=A0A450ZYN9_9GAMM|nr:MAG: hypothetical protein BECKUNK1418G_GA0071005_100547 [Candidatus Kentron sp. UNK]VFK68628.1 MAG: hypothetical protein BECKUNK1418H_GA0071006_100447 [Candidatus Kentron sp. UNK]